MRILVVPALIVSTAVLSGCGQPPKEWMKLGQRYTTAEFRRDHAACTKKGELDEACMKNKGWVAVNPGKEEKKPVDDNYRRPQERGY